MKNHQNSPIIPVQTNKAEMMKQFTFKEKNNLELDQSETPLEPYYALKPKLISLEHRYPAILEFSFLNNSN